MAKQKRVLLGKLVGRINVIFVLLTALVANTGFIGEQSVGASGLQWGEAQVSQVDGGSYFTCGVTDGRAFCWGMNGNGQLGNGTTVNSSSPTAVDSSGVLAGKSVTSVSSGSQSACALAQGQVYCWGQNAYGQLGNNSTIASLVPVAVNTSGVLAGKTVTAVASGASHVCVVASGQAYCWGRNFSGQLGNGTTTDSSVPVAVNTAGVLAGKTVTAVTAAGHSTCVLAQGAVYCWGMNDTHGQLGNGTTTDSSVPVAVNTAGVLAGKSITAIDAGWAHVCAVASNQVYCWGNNSNGQLGDNSTTNSSVPVAVNTAGVLAGKTVTAIAGGTRSTCALAQGGVYCWGYNFTGQLGNNSTTDSVVPVAVDTTGVLAGKLVTAVTLGDFHGCAIADNQVYCWGNNVVGELGTGTSLGKETAPVAVYQYKPPKITSVTFENDEHGKILVVHGQALFVSGSDAANQALMSGSIASLNDTPIVACAGDYLLAVLQSVPHIYNPAYYTAVPACYYIYSFDATELKVSSIELRIWVPDNFDITAPGKVSINTAPAFMFNTASVDNTPTTPAGGGQSLTTSAVATETPQATVKPTSTTIATLSTPEVKNDIATGAISFTADSKTLIDTPLISSLPVFRGKAAPYSTVTVTVHSDPVTCTTKADGEGNWECQLRDKLPAGNHTVNIAMTSPDNETTHLGPYPVHVASTASHHDDALPVTASEDGQKNSISPWMIIAAIAFVVTATWVAGVMFRRRKA